MDFRKIIIDGYRENGEKYVVRETPLLVSSSRIEYFVKMAESAMTENITLQKFFHECDNVLNRYDKELAATYLREKAEIYDKLIAVMELEQFDEKAYKIAQLEKGGIELVEKWRSKTYAFQVDENGQVAEIQHSSNVALSDSALRELKSDLRDAEKMVVNKPLSSSSEMQIENQTTENVINETESSTQDKQFADLLHHENKDALMKVVRELINKDKKSGIHIAKILEALQHKGYILINSYSIPEVITEFDIQCSKTAINKQLNKGKFYINPTRPENGITAELQQIVHMLP